VNNAGIGYRAWAGELEAAHVARVLATNVLGPLMVACRALPLLRRGERAVLVNVASTVGFRGMPSMSAYAASKAALRSIGESLRLEWAPYRIAVATLDPGVTATEIFERQHNPARLHDPDPAQADSPEAVARAVLALDDDPRPELCLRPKWRFLGALACVAPGLADRLLASRSWMPRPPPAASSNHGGRS
jgi:NAD(P)-dependent dehydrogenase (short-subunit alcohol dehydrogenase family)